MEEKEKIVHEGIEAAQDSQRRPDASADALVDAIMAAAEARPDITQNPRLRALFGRLSAVLSDTGYEDINEQVKMQHEGEDTRRGQMENLVDWTPPETGTTTINGVSWSYQKGVPCRIFRGVLTARAEQMKAEEEYGLLTQQMGGTPGASAGPVPVNLGDWRNLRG
jgi:hypothetical protein